MTSSLIQSWKAFEAAAHPAIAPIQSAEQYAQALSVLEELWPQAADPAVRLLIDLVSARLEAYEEGQAASFNPHASPAELLGFLLEQHGLKQKDLTDIAPQSVISEILSGKRSCSLNVAQKLAQRFQVSIEHFLPPTEG